MWIEWGKKPPPPLTATSLTKRHTTIGIYCNLCNLLFYKTHKIHIIRLLCIKRERKKTEYWNCKLKFNFCGDFFGSVVEKTPKAIGMRLGRKMWKEHWTKHSHYVYVHFFPWYKILPLSFHCLSNLRYVIEFWLGFENKIYEWSYRI